MRDQTEPHTNVVLTKLGPGWLAVPFCDEDSKRKTSNLREAIGDVIRGFSLCTMMAPTTDNGGSDDYADDPSASSAALCIRLYHLDQQFSVVYTHQCFEKEWIPGYQPFQEYLSKDASQQQQRQHRSYQYHQLPNQRELCIHITLSPSCETCHIRAQVRDAPPRCEELCQPPKSKKPRLGDDSTEEGNDINNNNNDTEHKIERDVSSAVSTAVGNDGKRDNEKEKDCLVSTQYGRETVSQEEGIGGAAPATLQQRLSPEDICQTLVEKGTVPPMRVDSVDKVAVTYLKQPIGTVLQEYSRMDMDFVLTLASPGDDDGTVASYHESVQNLALFFIETADPVDITATDGGYWKVLYLFCRHGTDDNNNNNEYSLVGYMTLFHFHAPFKKPKPGVVLRICQALLLPPYQRMGHGKELLRAVHRYAAAADSVVVEINVEDPSTPAFKALRNRIDLELLEASLAERKPWLPARYSKSVVEDSFVTLTDADAVAAGAIGRIVPRQVHTAYELHKLRQLLRYQDENSSDDNDYGKKYRLMVKRRLVKVHREDLSGCPTKEAKQALLEEIYQQVYQSYLAVLGGRQTKKNVTKNKGACHQ